MMKVHWSNYFIPKRIKSADEAKKLLTSAFKLKNSGRAPRFLINASLFEKEFDLKLLPENVIIFVKGKVKKPIKLIGSTNTEIRAGVFDSYLQAHGDIRLKAKKIKDDLIAWGRAEIQADTIGKNAYMLESSVLNIKKLKGELYAKGEARIEAGKFLDAVSLNHRAQARSNSRSGILSMGADTLYRQKSK